ncbi:hypothetical protein PsYK624_150010 [Phanerochaete sordida]|uniref:Uncharacterized protein n=1 Tax=Phanerochaete sordida TaxID=48140 RepID=A0A9P3GNK3_9APHY|nr:hypothetical protein PsYK624_150010 [Phanerochaete sordida]
MAAPFVAAPLADLVHAARVAGLLVHPDVPAAPLLRPSRHQRPTHADDGDWCREVWEAGKFAWVFSPGLASRTTALPGNPGADKIYIAIYVRDLPASTGPVPEPSWWFAGSAGHASLTIDALLTLWSHGHAPTWTGVHARVTAIRRKRHYAIATLFISTPPFRASLFCPYGTFVTLPLHVRIRLWLIEGIIPRTLPAPPPSRDEETAAAPAPGVAPTSVTPFRAAPFPVGPLFSVATLGIDGLLDGCRTSVDSPSRHDSPVIPLVALPPA